MNAPGFSNAARPELPVTGNRRCEHVLVVSSVQCLGTEITSDW